MCGATNRSISTYIRDNTCYKSYDRCVDYKRSSSSGLCYLTSACMEALQDEFDDDCHELTELRRFRDEYVTATHPAAVARYYEVAPQVVSRIEEREDSEAIYRAMYEDMVLPTITLFLDGKPENAYRVYKTYSDALEERFVSAARQSAKSDDAPRHE
ncbi:MAG: hypothetical protein LBG60_09735 [Bifidobacteriaceae bacterium]|nr:hypothetical protein [Bifidobacteriaceae bacterium]